MIASLLLFITFVILGIPTAIIFIPWSIITGNVLPLYNATQMIVRTGYFLARIHVVVVGRENVPAKTACIFMANHVSNLDPPALIPNIPGRTSAFLKRSLMHVPVLGWGFRQGEFIPVDRDGRKESAQESIAAARLVLAKGVHITTFVEGTRSRDGRMLPFKKGPILPGAGDRGALHSGFHLGHGSDDVEGKYPHSPRHGARHVSCAHFSGRLCNTRRPDDCRPHLDRFRLAGVDAKSGRNRSCSSIGRLLRCVAICN